MKKLLSILLMLLMLGTFSCTENSRAKNFGGTMKVVLPADKKLVTVTWKENQLWYLVRDRHDGEVLQTYTFHEESSLGMLEGTVIFIEQE